MNGLISRNFISVFVGFLLIGCGGGDETVSTPVPPPEPTTSAPPSIEPIAQKYANAAQTLTIEAVAMDDLGIISRKWEQLSGTAVSLTGENTETISFTAPSLDLGEDLIFEFTVVDAQDQSAKALAIVTINPNINNQSSVIIQVLSTSSLTFDDPDNPLILITGRNISPVSAAGDIEVMMDTQTPNRPVILAKENGIPMLISFSGLSNGTVEVSVKSSAIAFVLRSPRFYGAQISNRADLLTQIEAHPRFGDLTQVIEERLRTSACPMDPGCNARGARISDLIAQELDLTGLIAEGN